MDKITTVKQAKAKARGKVSHLKDTIKKNNDYMVKLEADINELKNDSKAKKGTLDRQRREQVALDLQKLALGYKQIRSINEEVKQELKDAEQKLASLESAVEGVSAGGTAPAPAEEPAAGGGKKSRIKKSRRKKSRKSKRRKRHSKKKKTYKRRR